MFFCPISARAMPVVINDGTTFVELVDELEGIADLNFDENSGAYVVPTAPQLADFRSLADSLWVASTDTDLQNLVAPAGALGYKAVKLINGGTTYFGVRESAPSRGWGSYFVRQGLRRDAMLQVPHPLFDTNTPEVAAKAFVQSQTRGFLMAGTHRSANGLNMADPAHLVDSIFLEVHESWNGPGGENIAWQVHAFDLDNYDDNGDAAIFPASTDAVLSNGTGDVSLEVVALDASIQALAGGWLSHAYNTLNVNDPLNATVNELVNGTLFSPLAGTTNKQQLHSTSVGGTFVHIELEQSFRLNGPANRQLAADAIAGAISQETALVPEPSSLALLILSGLGLVVPVRRLRRRR